MREKQAKQCPFIPSHHRTGLHTRLLLKVQAEERQSIYFVPEYLSTPGKSFIATILWQLMVTLTSPPRDWTYLHMQVSLLGANTQTIIQGS